MKRIFVCGIGLIILFTACTGNNERTASDTLYLNWYDEKDKVKQDMQNYTLINESEEVGAAGEIQTLLEYSDVVFYEQSCDVTLCFTSIGLIGLNYHDFNGQYEQWVEHMITSYGKPTETSDLGMTLWENNPVGEGTSIYVFDMQDYVQISFFAEETGSETISN